MENEINNIFDNPEIRKELNKKINDTTRNLVDSLGLDHYSVNIEEVRKHLQLWFIQYQLYYETIGKLNEERTDTY